MGFLVYTEENVLYLLDSKNLLLKKKLKTKLGIILSYFISFSSFICALYICIINFQEISVGDM
jgi:hypothetical protein